MEEKLRSILKPIHWSSLLKAAAFAFAWVLLPFWLFILIAIVFYFVPLFQPRSVWFPLLFLLVLCYIEPTSITYAIIFGGVFYIILLIKDLIFVDRRSAYELLVLVLSFTLLRDFFTRFNQGASGAALIYAFIVAVVLAYLIRSFIFRFHQNIGKKEIAKAAVWISFLILWQAIIAGLFLPLDYLYQTVIVFLIAVLLIDLVPEYLFGSITKIKVITAASAVSVLLLFVLGSARWTL